MTDSDVKPPKVQYLKDGFVITTKYAYKFKNGHSAWDGFVWKPYYMVQAPSGAQYSPEKLTPEFRKAMRAAEFVVSLIGPSTTDEDILKLFDAIGYYHIEHDSNLRSIYWGAKAARDRI